MALVRSFETKLSTPLVMLLTGYILTASLTRHHMNCSMGENPISHIFGYSVANSISTRSANTWFQRRCDIGILLGYSSKSKAYRLFNNTTGMVEETYDVEFDESNGT
ncbi:LOW QUALITY PROTEIN: hypothetical protein U9M48_039579 [Paspalum notatum var. saurae]|uniref:Retroviral polymerase SH3-like domain-containing protein n=1 Tax=Paspalum notatum var. saurae TaxID=547442 RepID=A0AAQ3XC88_PASNO